MTTINNLTKHDSREFKVGDLVVLNQCHSQNRVLKIQMFHEDFIRAFVRDSIKYSFGHKFNFRHATLEEIKAGHRIDDTTDHVTDIRNHLSPSTRQNVMYKCKAFDVWLDKRLCEMEAIGLDEAFYAGWQSRQSEFEATTEALLNQTQLLAKQKVEIEEKDKRIESQSNCIENLVVQKSDYLDKVTKAIAHLDSFDHSKASINKLQRSIECALEALRGEHANS